MLQLNFVIDPKRVLLSVLDPRPSRFKAEPDPQILEFHKQAVPPGMIDLSILKKRSDSELVAVVAPVDIVDKSSRP